MGKPAKQENLRQCSHCAAMFNPRSIKGAVHLATCKVYNGHKNYETWVVSLWIDNDEGSYNHWKKEAEACREEATDEHPGMSMITEERRAVFLLGKRLK